MSKFLDCEFVVDTNFKHVGFLISKDFRVLNCLLDLLERIDSDITLDFILVVDSDTQNSFFFIYFKTFVYSCGGHSQDSYSIEFLLTQVEALCG